MLRTKVTRKKQDATDIFNKLFCCFYANKEIDTHATSVKVNIVLINCKIPD